MAHALEILRESEREKRRLDAERQAAHERIAESLSYARKLQAAALPQPTAQDLQLADLAVLWEPRDEVGGDVYYAVKRGDTTVIILMDCTGHGVPGALIAFVALAAVERILSRGESWTPRMILEELDARVRGQLHRSAHTDSADDGLCAGVAVMDHRHKSLQFAGVGIDLFVHADRDVTAYRGNRGGLGYREPLFPKKLREEVFSPADPAQYFLATDGLLEQLGGEKELPLGRRGLTRLLGDAFPPAADLGDGLHQFRQEFAHWQGREMRLDDVTLIAFQPSSETPMQQPDSLSRVAQAPA